MGVGHNQLGSQRAQLTSFTCFLLAALQPCNTMEKMKDLSQPGMWGTKPLVGEERSVSFITQSGRESLRESESAQSRVIDEGMDTEPRSVCSAKWCQCMDVMTPLIPCKTKHTGV